MNNSLIIIVLSHVSSIYNIGGMSSPGLYTVYASFPGSSLLFRVDQKGLIKIARLITRLARRPGGEIVVP